MDKAIAILKMMATNENLTGVYHNEANQAIDELTAYKTKIEDIATDLQNISQYLKDEVHPRCEYGIYSRLEDLNGAVLQKLEELDK